MNGMQSAAYINVPQQIHWRSESVTLKLIGVSSAYTLPSQRRFEGQSLGNIVPIGLRRLFIRERLRSPPGVVSFARLLHRQCGCQIQ